MAQRKQSGGDKLCDILNKLGVTTVFGLPGTQNVHLFESFRNSSLRTIVATTELAAGFMAVGFYRATGRVALLATIPGPGFTYALTPLVEAKHDSAALLYLIVRTGGQSDNAFRLQALEQQDICRSFIKKYFQIEKTEDIASALAEAYHTATTGEPGPVVIEMSSSVVSSDTGITDIQASPLEPRTPPIDDSDVEEVVSLLAASCRPVLMLGQGAAGAFSDIRRLTDILGSPVLATNSGRGIVPENHSLFVAGDLTYRTVGIANELISGSDLVLALGCKFTHNGSAGFHLKLPPEKFIHVDTAREVLGANYPGKMLIQADITAFVQRLLQSVEKLSDRPGRWDPDAITRFKSQFRSIVNDTAKTFPRPSGIGDINIKDFFGLFREALPDDACVVTDSGLHQLMVRRFFEVRSPRGLILPSDFQSMGFGMPASIGAKLADPDRKIALVIGDGGMAMSAMELLTAARENINLPVMVINDGHLGQIRSQQWSNYGHDFAVKLRNPDFEMLARSFGINYFRPGEEPRETLRQWLAAPGVSLMEVRVEDSPQMRVERAKSILKQAAKDRLHAAIIRWIKKLLRQGS